MISKKAKPVCKQARQTPVYLVYKTVIPILQVLNLLSVNINNNHNLFILRYLKNVLKLIDIKLVVEFQRVLFWRTHLPISNSSNNKIQHFFILINYKKINWNYYDFNWDTDISLSIMFLKIRRDFMPSLYLS